MEKRIILLFLIFAPFLAYWGLTADLSIEDDDDIQSGCRESGLKSLY